MIDIISLISGAHDNLREKIALGIEYTNEFGPTIDGSSVTTVNFNRVMRYLSENLLVHFRQEEILIDVIRENVDISAEEERIISKILREHRRLRMELGKLSEFKFVDDLNYEVIRDFSENSRRLLNDLFQHAKEEDEDFYPFAREKMSPERIVMIEDRLNQLVK